MRVAIYVRPGVRLLLGNPRGSDHPGIILKWWRYEGRSKISEPDQPQ